MKIRLNPQTQTISCELRGCFLREYSQYLFRNHLTISYSKIISVKAIIKLNNTRESKITFGVKSLTIASKISKIFSRPDLKHGLSLFTIEEISAVELSIIEKENRFLIKCQIKEKYKVAKPEI